jgi:hypothetical protein
VVKQVDGRESERSRHESERRLVGDIGPVNNRCVDEKLV